MTTAVRQSREIYRLLIKLYPATFQREFAAEMLDVFEAQLADACAENGVFGFARVWGGVMAEMLNGPAARGILHTVFGVPGISVVSSSALFLLFFWASGLAKVCR